MTEELTEVAEEATRKEVTEDNSTSREDQEEEASVREEATKAEKEVATRVNVVVTRRNTIPEMSKMSNSGDLDTRRNSMEIMKKRRQTCKRICQQVVSKS